MRKTLTSIMLVAFFCTCHVVCGLGELKRSIYGIANLCATEIVVKSFSRCNADVKVVEVSNCKFVKIDQEFDNIEDCQIVCNEVFYSNGKLNTGFSVSIPDRHVFLFEIFWPKDIKKIYPAFELQIGEESGEICFRDGWFTDKVQLSGSVSLIQSITKKEVFCAPCLFIGVSDFIKQKIERCMFVQPWSSVQMEIRKKEEEGCNDCCSLL